MTDRNYHHRTPSGWPVWITAGATLIFGLALLIWPGMTTSLILNVCGGALLAVGGFKIIRYFMNKDPYDIFSWDLGSGILLACAGLALILFKSLLLSIVPLLFGIALLICGIVKIQAAFNLRRMTNRYWYLTLVGAAVSCAFGLLISLNPFGTGLILIRVIGGALVIEAIQDILSLRTYNRTVDSFFVR